jgi:hypothetical protein
VAGSTHYVCNCWNIAEHADTAVTLHELLLTRDTHDQQLPVKSVPPFSPSFHMPHSGSSGTAECLSTGSGQRCPHQCPSAPAHTQCESWLRLNCIKWPSMLALPNWSKCGSHSCTMLHNIHGVAHMADPAASCSTLTAWTASYTGQAPTSPAWYSFSTILSMSAGLKATFSWRGMLQGGSHTGGGVQVINQVHQGDPGMLTASKG